MKTKLNELLEFPTPFTYKVMGQALPELVDPVSYTHLTLPTICSV